MTSTNEAPGQAGAGEAEPPEGWPAATVALDLARQMIAEWRAIGTASRRARASDDPTAHLRLEIAGAGKQQMEAAQLAERFALVSIAEDIRRVADVLCRADDTLDRLDRAKVAPEPMLPGFEINADDDLGGVVEPE